MKTDEELVLLCRERDADAWEALVRRYQSRMLNLAYQFTSNTSTAEDLAQDIFVRLYESMELYQAGRPFKTWLNSLARNLCIDHYRKRRKERNIVDKPVDEFRNLATHGDDTDRDLEQRERRELLERALDRLAPLSREAIVLKDFQGLSHEEMAEIAGVPVGTMKSRVSRARADLAQILVKIERTPAVAPGGTHGMS